MSHIFIYYIGTYCLIHYYCLGSFGLIPAPLSLFGFVQAFSGSFGLVRACLGSFDLVWALSGCSGTLGATLRPFGVMQGHSGLFRAF